MGIKLKSSHWVRDFQETIANHSTTRQGVYLKESPLLKHIVNLNGAPEETPDVETAQNAKTPYLGNR